MKQSYKTIGLLITTCTLAACNTTPIAFEGDTLTVTGVEDGTKLILDNNMWQEKFSCRQYDALYASGAFAFSIRQHKDNNTSALLILPDFTYYSGELVRDGLNWEFDWDEGQKSYTVHIKQDGSAFYFDWSLADSDGKMTTSRDYTCN